MLLSTKPRARHINCRWPTEKWRPRSATSASSPPSRSTTSARWHLASMSTRRLLSCWCVGSRFSRMLPLNRNGSCGMIARRDLEKLINNFKTIFCSRTKLYWICVYLTTVECEVWMIQIPSLTFISNVRNTQSRSYFIPNRLIRVNVWMNQRVRSYRATNRICNVM